MSEWVDIDLEVTRVIYFKSRKEPITLTNVTQFKMRGHGFLLKCDQGIVYCEKDDISCIISDCTDWKV